MEQVSRKREEQAEVSEKGAEGEKWTPERTGRLLRRLSVAPYRHLYNRFQEGRHTEALSAEEFGERKRRLDQLSQDELGYEISRVPELVDEDEGTEYILSLGLENFSDMPLRYMHGVNSEQAWKEREDYTKQGRTAAALRSLVGLDTPRAWDMRSRYDPKEMTDELLFSVGGIDSPQAWEWRRKVLKKEWMCTPWIEGMVNSLRGLDTEEAWEMRRYLLQEFQKYPENERMRSEWLLVSGLSYLDSTEAQAEREGLKGHTNNLLRGVTGLDDGWSWQQRIEARKSPAGNQLALRSLAGLDTPQAWDMRQSGLEMAKASGSPASLYNNLLLGLAGLGSRQAWDMRRQIQETRREAGADEGTIARELANSVFAGDMANPRLYSPYIRRLTQEGKV